MRTVKEVAELLDVSNQTIYNHIEKNKFDLNNHIDRIAGTQHLDDTGVEIIKKSMGLISENKNVQQLSLQETVSEISKIVLKGYQKEIESNFEISNQYIENTISEQFNEFKEIVKKKSNEKEKLEKKIKELEIELEKSRKEIMTLKEEIILEKNKGFFEKVFK